MDMNARSLLNAVPAAGMTQPDARVSRPGYFVVGAGDTGRHAALIAWFEIAVGSAGRTAGPTVSCHRDRSLRLWRQRGSRGGKAVYVWTTRFGSLRLISTSSSRRTSACMSSATRTADWSHCDSRNPDADASQASRCTTRSCFAHCATMIRRWRRSKGLAEKVAGLVTAGQAQRGRAGFRGFLERRRQLCLPSDARRKTALARRVDKIPLDFEAALRWPLSPVDLRIITVPTLLLAGARSPTVAKRIIASLTRELPNRRVRWIDAGHMGPITHAHRVNPWIETFR